MCNNNKKVTVYLAGGINALSDAEANDWRDEITGLLKNKYKKDIIVLNPMIRDYRGKEGDWEEAIVTADKRDINNSDLIICYLKKPSFGTAMELMYAYEGTLGHKMINIGHKIRQLFFNAAGDMETEERVHDLLQTSTFCFWNSNKKASPWLSYHSRVYLDKETWQNEIMKMVKVLIRIKHGVY